MNFSPIDIIARYIEQVLQLPACENITSSVAIFNIFSNFGFFLSAFLSYKLIIKNRVKNSVIRLMPFLILIVGIGSTLWHSLESVTFLLLDVSPIWIFIFLSLYLLLTLLKGKRIAVFTLLALALVEILIMQYIPRTFLDGSSNYISVFFLGCFLLIVVYRRSAGLAFNLGVVLAVFGLAILARTADRPLCDLIPIGTHFLWHLIVALAAYLVVRFLILAEKDLTKK